MKLKWVWRYDPLERKLRIARLMWERGVVGDGDGYSAKLAVGLKPRLFRFEREHFGWRIVLFGLDFHHRRAYGGRFC